MRLSALTLCISILRDHFKFFVHTTGGVHWKAFVRLRVNFVVIGKTPDSCGVQQTRTLHLASFSFLKVVAAGTKISSILEHGRLSLSAARIHIAVPYTPPHTIQGPVRMVTPFIRFSLSKAKLPKTSKDTEPGPDENRNRIPCHVLPYEP